MNKITSEQKELIKTYSLHDVRKIEINPNVSWQIFMEGKGWLTANNNEEMLDLLPFILIFAMNTFNNVSFLENNGSMGLVFN